MRNARRSGTGPIMAMLLLVIRTIELTAPNGLRDLLMIGVVYSCGSAPALSNDLHSHYDTSTLTSRPPRHDKPSMHVIRATMLLDTECMQKQWDLSMIP